MPVRVVFRSFVVFVEHFCASYSRSWRNYFSYSVAENLFCHDVHKTLSSILKLVAACAEYPTLAVTTHSLRSRLKKQVPACLHTDQRLQRELTD